MGRYLTTADVAKRLQVTPYTVRKWCRDGWLEGVRLEGDTSGWRIPESALAAFVEARTRQAATGGREQGDRWQRGTGTVS